MTETENLRPAGAGVAHSPAWAQWVSDVFSPVMMPTFGMVVAMWCTNMRSIPGSARVIATIIVAVVTALIPFATITFLVRTGRVSARSIPDRHHRLLPMSVASVCYAGAAILVDSLGSPRWLSLFFWGGALATVVAMLITLRWKISAHTTAVGCFVGMTAWLAANGLADIDAMTVLSVVIIIAGLVATSRLMLHRHNFAQVVAGVALGFACCFGLMYFQYI